MIKIITKDKSIGKRNIPIIFFILSYEVNIVANIFSFMEK